MDQDNATRTGRFPRKAVIAASLGAGVAVACFVAVALLPETELPFFDSPLRSLLAGGGLLGVACPLCITGSLLKRHSAGSPYFEEAFIAGVLNLFGFVALALAAACILLAAYAVVHRFLA